jgi:hypothetical protein
MVGTPTVSTAIGMEGLHLRDGEHVLQADGPQAFAEAVTRLVTDRSLWMHIATEGRKQIRSDHGSQILREAWRRVIASVMHRQPKPPVDGGTTRPHGKRWRSEEYDTMRSQILEIIRESVPPGAIVLVVSKGDDRLLALPGCKGWHFPQTSGGVFAGHYPADSEAAIAHLEALRTKGAKYLLLPGTASWWLEHYSGFKQHLEQHYRLVFFKDSVCNLYELAPRANPSGFREHEQPSRAFGASRETCAEP